MNIKKRFIAAILALITTVSLVVVSSTAVHAEQENSEFEFEALSSYPFGHMSWGVSHMGLDKLQKKLENSGRALPEVRVAVIDSGINTSNIFLKGRYTDDGWNFINNTSDFSDDQYHGTMVSGIIADATSSNVKILPIKVNDAEGRGNIVRVSQGIYYAIDHGADVINLSLSAEDPNRTITKLDQAIKDALDRGITIVVAAGNQSGDIQYRYPANKDNVLTITSIDKNHKIGEHANTGDGVDFALPGVSVTAPYMRAMFIKTGTSMAAPHAAAAAALLKTWDKSLNQSEIRDILIKYSVDLGEKGYDTTYGWGMIDLSDFDINTEERPAPPATEAATEPVTEAPTEQPTQIPTETLNTLLGDADTDGEVCAADATSVQRKTVSAYVPVFDDKAADVDSDGEITVTDATFIQRWAVGVSCPYNIGEPI